MVAAAIVPAAGSGSRMGGPAKQYRTLGDAPVLVQTLRALGGVEAVQRLVVVAPRDRVQATREELDRYDLGAPVGVVAGGATRQASVGQGLAAVPDRTDVVLVHDAVRPFVAHAHVEAVLHAAEAEGAAALAVPVADTLRRGEESRFGETVDRTGLWRMQTPQAARLDLLREAHVRFRDVPGTDEVELLQRAGVSVAIVEGDPANLKLTRPADWAFAEAFWPVWLRTRSG